MLQLYKQKTIMKKLLLLFLTGIGSLTATHAQVQTLELTTTASSLNAIKISENGYILEEITPGVYQQKTITVTSTNCTGDLNTYDNGSNAYFVVKNQDASPLNVATAGTLTTGNAATVYVDPSNAAINTRTWIISQLTPISPAATIPQGTAFDYRASNGTSPAPINVTVVGTYTVPVVEKTIYEFNNGNDTEGFAATKNYAVAVSAGKMTITATAIAGSQSDVGFIEKSGQNNFVNATSNKYVHIFYKNKSTNSQIRFIANGGGFNYVTGTNVNMTDADPYVEAVLDLSGASFTWWTGNISTFSLQLRINNSNVTAGSLVIDRIVFSNAATLGVSGNKITESVAAYPNPTTGTVTLSDIKNSKTIYIYNMLGATVKTMPASNSVDLSNLAAGTYILKTDTGLGTKIIKN